jgi:GR25 family glycosyltransferase involved in LPS biosynthesis
MMNKLTAYIINLKHRTDRYVHMVNEMKKLPISYEFIEGIIDGSKTCFQSQKKCIQLAKDNKLPYILILEDDAVFVENAQEHFDISFNKVAQLEWDMFFLGANLQAPTKQITPNLLKLNGAYAAHAYMVHERFYDTILNLPHICEMDVHYNNLMETHNVYMCDPMIAYQLPSHSDLQDGFRDYNQAIHNNYLRFKP